MEGLKKDQNPLVLAVTARLCLEEKYQHHLKIFTDGSVMEDGAAGAAFVIPEFNHLTHSYSLPAVSVFIAELLAISMALQHISAIPVTPFAIVICSDSKAALTAVKSDSQNAREDLVREIATTTHQLITRGTEVRFQWVPAHVCLSGNEKADRAAKRGAKGVDSSTVTMKIGLADVYAELTKQAWKQWEKEFHPMATVTAKEWDDTSPPCRAGVFFPGIPTYLARIICTWASGDVCAYRRSVSVGWASRFTTWCSPAPHVQTTSNHWLGNYAAWDCPCVQKAWQCATSANCAPLLSILTAVFNKITGQKRQTPSMSRPLDLMLVLAGVLEAPAGDKLSPVIC